MSICKSFPAVFLMFLMLHICTHFLFAAALWQGWEPCVQFLTGYIGRTRHEVFS